MPTAPAHPLLPTPPFEQARAAQERKIVMIVGVFFFLAVALWLTNKLFGPPHLQSNLVLSENFGIGTDATSYATGSGGTVRVPIRIETPVGQRLRSVRLVLGPWPNGASRPAFEVAEGASANVSVSASGSGAVLLSMDNVAFSPGNPDKVGEIAFRLPPGSPEAVVGMLGGPDDAAGTAIVAVDLQGRSKEVRLGSPSFFRLSATERLAGSGALLSSPTASARPVVVLPDPQSLLRAFFGLTSTRRTGSGQALSGSGSQLYAAPPVTRTTGTQGVDLRIDVQAPADRVVVGQPFQSRMTLSNRGNTQARNVRLALTVPEQVRIVELSPRTGCAVVGQAINCALPTVDPGQIVPVVAQLRTNLTGNFVLQATVRADGPDANQNDNQASGTVLSVRDTASPTPSVTPKPSSTPVQTTVPSTHQPTPTVATPVPTAPHQLPKTGPLSAGLGLIGSGIGLYWLRRRLGA